VPLNIETIFGRRQARTGESADPSLRSG